MNIITTVGDEPVLFIDGVHPTQATKISYGWIRKGQKKSVKTTGSRTRLNIMGALDLKAPEGKVWHHADKDKMILIDKDVHDTFPHTGSASILIHG